jgi:flagella basal body P-ring formation protein FlgA
MKLETLPAALFVFVALSLLGWSSPPGELSSLCRAASAAGRVEILSHVTVEGKRVTLLDLCDQTDMSEEWKALLAKDDLGAAPPPGSEKFIQSEPLQSHIQRYLASRGHDSSQITIYVPERIIVASKSIEVPKEQIESIYRTFVLSKAPWNPRDVEIRGIYFPGTIQLPSGEMTFEVEAAPRERFAGNVTITIHFLINGERERSVRVAGKVDLFQKVVHAARPLKRGEIVSDLDIMLEKVNISEGPDRFAAQPDQVVGKRLVRDVGSHQPVNVEDIDQPLAFKRGSPVTIVYANGGLRLTAKGQAREDGIIGSTVRITNVMTKRTIVGLVVDESTVQAIP